jgi:hypothetical protein
MLSVASHCVVRQHQLAMGNDFGSPAIPARKYLRGDKRFNIIGYFIVEFV